MTAQAGVSEAQLAKAHLQVGLSLYQVETDEQGRAGIRLRFHPGQQRAWDAPQRFVGVTAGSQSGKTCFGPHWVRREVELVGGGDGGVITATYPLLVQKILPEMRAIFERLDGWQYQGGEHPKSTATLTRPEDGARIFLGSAQTPQESGTWRWAWEDECGLPEFGMEADRGIQRRVQLSQGRILRTTTPYRWGWHKSEVWDRGEPVNRDYQPDYVNINFRSCDNPAYPMLEYERLKRELPDWYAAMFLDGLYTRPAGQIYRDFDEAVQIFNGTEYGLTGGLFSRSPERIERAKREFCVGNLYINRKITGALVGVQPFGGFKLSGTNAKAGGPDYLRLFMEMKTVAQRL